MEWLRGKLLTQSLERNVFGNRYHKRSRTALRYEVLSIYHDSADSIAEVAQRLISLLKVLSTIRHDESNHVLGNEDRRTLSALVHLVDYSRPLPKEAGPGSNFHSVEVAREREVLAGKRGPCQVGCWKIHSLDVLDRSEMEFFTRIVCYINRPLLRAVVVCP